MIAAKKIQLGHPITLDGKKVKHLYVRAPRYTDLADDEGGNFLGNQPGMVRLAIHCTELREGGDQLPGAAVEQLSPVDILKLMGAIQHFFTDLGETSETSVKKDESGSSTGDQAEAPSKTTRGFINKPNLLTMDCQAQHRPPERYQRMVEYAVAIAVRYSARRQQRTRWNSVKQSRLLLEKMRANRSPIVVKHRIRRR